MRCLNLSGLTSRRNILTQKNPDEAVKGYLVGEKDEGPVSAKPVYEGDQVIAYDVTFRKKNPNATMGKVPGREFAPDEVKRLSIRNFGDRENFFNQVVNPYADKRNTQKQKGEVTELKAEDKVIQVELNGRIGEMPESKWPDFKKKYPNAKKS